MSFDLLRLPLAFFQAVLGPYAPLDPGIVEYAAWWASEGRTLADGSNDARRLSRGYAAGIIQRVHVQETLLPSFALLYITAFHNSDIATRYAESLVTRHIVDKYAPDDVRESLLARLHATENPAQGGIWLPQASPLAAHAATDGWRLTGDDLPNDGAVDLMLVAARPDGTDGDALFIAPRLQADSLAYLLATPGESTALRMETETLCLLATTIIRLGAAQHDLSHSEVASEPADGLHAALALAWAAAQAGDDTAREVAGLYSDAYQRFRSLAHLAELQSLEIASAVASISGGPTGQRVEQIPGQLPAELLRYAQQLLAELAEFTGAAGPPARQDDANAWAQALAQAFKRKFEAAAVAR